MTTRLPPSDQHPVIPDERDQMSRGAHATAAIERSDLQSRQAVRLLQCISALLNRYAPDVDVYHLSADELRNIDLPKVRLDEGGGIAIVREV